jgi:hypothetical protein
MNSCNVGYEGALCSRCSPGYFLNSNACEICDGRENASSSRLTFYAMIALVGIGIFIFIVRKKFSPKSPVEASTDGSSFITNTLML